MKEKKHCLILDDEPLAVQLIADYASKIPELHVLYAGGDVYKAIEILNKETVDLIFLDIQMPQLTGIELMEMFNQKHHFILTSAYSSYALDAFEFNVIDFLLKPITFRRFCQSVEKYEHWKDNFRNQKANDFLIVRADRKDHRINTDSILYVEGLKDYIRIHTRAERIMVLENMKDFLDRLPPKQFIRIHRSYIIPLAKIKAIEGNRVQMVNGEVLPIGETYRKKVGKWLLS